MQSTLLGTPLGTILTDCSGLLGAGKMLRARMCLRTGSGVGSEHKTLVHCAAAVEMIHAASLLHDDVIDGGILRRGLPSFWVEKGVSGAILLGDLLLFKAVDLVCQVESGRLAHALVLAAGEICEAESAQELVLRGTKSDWEHCVDIARSKTGALFAFAAEAGAGTDPQRAKALKEAGYLVGTAYQLADDILDSNGTTELAGKTLGTDEARKKTTAVRVESDGVNPEQYLFDLCEQSKDLLSPWPDARKAWSKYLDTDFIPSVEKLVGPCSEKQTA